MLEISFWHGMAAFTAVWIIARVIVWIKNRRIDWRREAQLLLMYVNLAVIIRFTFFPFEKVDGKIQPLIFDPVAMFPPNLNLIPFVNITDNETTAKVLINLIGNIAMFIPTGIILPILYKKLDSFWKVVLAGAAISLCIEIAQLPFVSRVSDVDDLVLNTLGTAAGYGIYTLCQKIFNKQKKSMRIKGVG